MKKVAICISGQYRTFDKIWSENLKILKKDKGYHYDFFCYFWNKKGETPRVLEGQNRKWSNLFIDPFIYYPKNNNQKVNERKIKSIIPNARVVIANTLEKKLLQKDGVLNLLKKYPDNKKSAFNSFCMWKAIYNCDEIRTNFQKKYNKKYDYVMRIRPDWKLKKNPLNAFKNKNTKTLFFDSTSIKTKKKSYLSVTDVCFVTKDKTMKIISNLYNTWVMEIKKKGWKQYSFGDPSQDYRLVAETVLFWHIKNKKIVIPINTLGEYGFIYRSFYENNYLKKKFSIKLLIKQLFQSPKKIFNSFK